MMSGKVEKSMRKGTKSCLDCRRRKIKCIFKADDTQNCVSCKIKGKTCVEQKKGLVQAPSNANSRTSLEERVAQLEALLQSHSSASVALLSPQTLASNERSQSSPGGLETPQDDNEQELNGQRAARVTTQHEVTPDAHTDIPQNIDPVGSLFNNGIWKQKHSDRGTGLSLSDNRDSGSFGQDVLSKDSRICDELCKDLPSPRLLASILDTTCSWWNTWQAVGSWLRESMAEKNIHTLQKFVAWALTSSEPPFAALGILSVAISLQQLDPKADEHIIRQLSHPPGVLFHEYFDRVNRLVINQNCYSTSRAGIEVIKMSAKTLMSLGLLKMTWILNHRAITHAQLLGLHCPHQISPNETVSRMSSRQVEWFTLCQHDLYISLVLGLPYANDGKLISSSVYGAPGTLTFFRYRVTRLSAQVVDRNQMGYGTRVSKTLDIERDVDAAANELPIELWDPPTAVRQGTIDQSEYIELLASQFWFFQLKVLLHQPLMIQSIEDRRLSHNRNACLTACRETLKIYHLMHSETSSAFGMIKLVDYQAFVCSAILLLGLLGYGSINQAPISQSVDQEGDWDRVQSILDTLRKASTDANNSIASQAVQGLESLATIVYSGTNGVCATSNGQTSGCSMKITIPGSGVITIGPGKLIQNSISRTSEAARSILHLSHSVPQDSRHQPEAAGLDLHQITDTGPSIIHDTDFSIQTMDFDWTNMVDMDLGDDWAWLADVNGGVF